MPPTIVLTLVPLLLILTAPSGQGGAMAPQSGPMTHHVDPDQQGRLQRFEARLEALRQEHHIPGLSVAVVKGQEVIYLKGLGGKTTPDTAYSIPALNRLPGQTWTVRELAHLDVLLARGARPESRPYLAWHVEEAGGVRLQWSWVHEKEGSLLYLKVPDKGLALILLAGGAVDKAPFSAAFLQTFLG